MTEKIAQLPADLTDPVEAARHMVDHPEILVSGPGARRIVKELLDALPKRIQAAVELDRRCRRGHGT